MRWWVQSLALLAGAVALVSTALGNSPKSRTFQMTYKAVVKDIPPKAKVVELWLPIPQSNSHQEISKLQVQSPFPYRLTREKEYGNAMLYVRAKKPKQTSFEVSVTFVVQRRENRVDLNGKPAEAVPTDEKVRRFLQPDALVPVGGRFKRIAEQVVSGSNSVVGKASRLYEHVLAEMSYDKSGTGWGRGDANYACDVKRGNCTDFHAYFTALGRSIGIPVKFEIGFPIPKDKTEGILSGYHCWAYFLEPQLGWVPVDISEADKDQQLADYYFGSLDENRVAFTVGRDLLLSPPQKGSRLNFFIYPYAEVDGKRHEAVEREVSFKDLGDCGCGLR